MLSLIATITFFVVLMVLIAVIGSVIFAGISIIPVVAEFALTLLAVRWIVYVLKKR